MQPHSKMCDCTKNMGYCGGMDFTDPTTKIALVAFGNGLIGVAYAIYKERKLKREGELLAAESEAGRNAKRAKVTRIS